LASRAALGRGRDVFPQSRQPIRRKAPGRGYGRGRGRSYINERHQVTAMLQAGVRRTVVIHWATPEETETGSPASTV
jgi:hypothetical protein